MATGVAWRLHRSGFAVVVLELADPLTVRRRVALSSAVHEGVVEIEGLIGRRASTFADAVALTRQHEVAVVVAPDWPTVWPDGGRPSAVVDARLAKRNIDTTIDDAPLVIGLGPGFAVGIDCHAVVETMRGAQLGRVFWTGSAAENTGTPGEVGGHGADRVLRAPCAGVVAWSLGIGAQVASGDVIGRVGDAPVAAPFDGVVRGLIRPGTRVTVGLKVGDVDPRGANVAADEISDKALAVGGGVLEAVLTWLAQSDDSGALR